MRFGFRSSALLIAMVVLTVLLSQPASAQILFSEPFDNDSQFTTSSGLFSDGGFDYLGIAGFGALDFDGDPIPSGLKTYTGFDGTYLTGMDLDGEGAALPIEVEWNGIDIDGFTDLEFSGLFAEFFDAPGDIDSDDFVLVEYQIDSGGYQTLVDFRLDEDEPDNFNGVFREDTNGSGRGDGEVLTEAAKLFTKPIAGTGSLLDLRLTSRVNAGDEDFAVDSLQVTATPVPTSVLFNEPFDNDSQFTTSSGLFSDGGFDYLGIAGTGTLDFDGDPIPSGLKAYTGFDGTYLTGMDLDGEGAALPVEVEWNGIDISGSTDLEFSGLFAEFFDAPGDIDFDDFVLVEYQIDSGGYQTLLEFRLDEDEPDNFNGVFREDTNGSGRGDGEVLTETAKLFTKPIAGTGSLLDLRLTSRLNAGDEDFAVDSLQVTATPVPTSVLFNEPFDDDSQFTTSSGLFSDGGFDYLGIAGTGTLDFDGDPVPSGLKAYTGFDGTFLTGMDLDGEGAALPIEVLWTGIDIDGFTDLEFSGLFAEFFDAPGDIDFDDFVLVEYQIDGGGYQTLIEFRLDEDEPDNFNGALREDTNGSGRGDGEILTEAAKLFTKPIAGTGSLLDLRLTIRLNAGDEDFAVDNFMITATTIIPEPGTLVLLVVGALASLCVRWPRR